MLPKKDCDQTAIQPEDFQRLFVDENWLVHLIRDEVLVQFGRELAFKAVLKDGEVGRAGWTQWMCGSWYLEQLLRTHP